MAERISYLKLPRKELQNIINESTSIHEVLKKLGYNGSGDTHIKFKSFLQDRKFDTSTLVGRAIGRNKNKNPKTHLINALIENGTANSARLKERLINYGVKEDKCEVCGVSMWQNEKLKLELHHINGNHTDNRLENLIILCPNCHSLTHNFRGKNSNTEKEKEKLNKLIEIAKKDAEFKLPKLIEESIKLKNKPKTLIGNKPIKVKVYKNKCIVCGKETENKSFCSIDCYNKHIGKNKLTKEQLLELSKQVSSLAELNRKINLGITDNAVKKWCDQYGIYDEIKNNFKQRTFPILQYDLDNNFIKEWKDADTIVKELGLNKSKIQSCCRGKQKMSAGFKWRYKKD